MAVFLNDKRICLSSAEYGTTMGVSKASAGGQPWTTISKMSDCTDAIPVKKGDKLRLEAAYDEKTHPLYVFLIDLVFDALLIPFNSRRESQGIAQEEMGLVAFSFSPA
jgi:hypothetical protein